ncbi:phosphate-starvation-inducible PsiE family protein [Microbulbifer sp. OS29]|uniref:Phosphate-starvation-inducible PsiE family protein n=1 Tax=Microbulbifer okhotskensis TaxID=2926617 RepID=A0A9X2ERG8_9GAMM|nr:phosphate-starvation-inducible PsiE family protein [Microbulbifer okhotskensis]MCO1336445.1 phosphate-starvation-inducible PsiE family protein [Microbulbifer okhotskensis]
MKYDEIHEDHDDPLINQLHRAIKLAVKFLAILMVLVIFLTIADVVYVLYQRLMETPFLLLDMEDILETFGAFLVVLIAIEIFTNIRLYLGTSVIPVQLVLATALMAVARKVIVLDLKLVSAEQIVGIALVTIALGVSYWLVREKAKSAA